MAKSRSSSWRLRTRQFHDALVIINRLRCEVIAGHWTSYACQHMPFRIPSVYANVYIHVHTDVYIRVYRYTLYRHMLYSLCAYRCGLAYTWTPTWNQIECTLPLWSLDEGNECCCGVFLESLSWTGYEWGIPYSGVVWHLRFGVVSVCLGLGQ